MSAGEPGDHPVTDIIYYNLRVYGEACDQLIKNIFNLVSFNTLYEMFDWYSISTTSETSIREFEKVLQTKFKDLKDRAIKDGWEIE